MQRSRPATLQPLPRPTSSTAFLAVRVPCLPLPLEIGRKGLPGSSICGQGGPLLPLHLLTSSLLPATCPLPCVQLHGSCHGLAVPCLGLRGALLRVLLVRRVAGRMRAGCGHEFAQLRRSLSCRERANKNWEVTQQQVLLSGMRSRSRAAVRGSRRAAGCKAGAPKRCHHSGVQPCMPRLADASTACRPMPSLFAATAGPRTRSTGA